MSASTLDLQTSATLLDQPTGLGGLALSDRMQELCCTAQYQNNNLDMAGLTHFAGYQLCSSAVLEDN